MTFFEHLKTKFPRKSSGNDVTCVANHKGPTITYILSINNEYKGEDYVHLYILFHILFIFYFVTLSVAVTLNC